MTAETTTATRPHGELACADAEAILHDTTLSNSDLRAQLGLALQMQEDLEHQVDMLRLDGDRARALLDDVSAKNTDLINEREGLQEQVKILHEEMAALEGDAVPEGTLLFATLDRDDMVAHYRRASRINRGPIPPSVVAAVESARDDIIESMKTVGSETLKAVVTREVRRRRRTQSLATNARRR